jgi:hypothetical protein
MCTVGLPRPPKVEAKGLTARNWMKRISYYVPVTAWIPGYSWSLYVLLAFRSVSSPPCCGENGVDPVPGTDFSRLPLCFVWYFSLGGDFLAGLTVACILIPQSVSYGTSLARLSPTAGLVCHIPFRFLSPSTYVIYPMTYVFPIRSFRRLSPGYSTPCSVPLVS